MKPYGKVSPLLLLVALSGCASIAVNQDYNPRTDFGSYHTFRWAPEPQNPTGDARIDNNPLLDSRIRSAVERHLTAKGFQKRDGSNADLLVAYQVAISDETDISTLSTYYGYRRTGIIVQDTRIREYEQGTLILDLVDASRNELVWRGTAQSEIRSDMSPQDREARIDEAVRTILAQYPPGS